MEKKNNRTNDGNPETPIIIPISHIDAERKGRNTYYRE